MSREKHDRRRFLGRGAALAGLALGAGATPSARGQATEPLGSAPKDTRPYGERSRFETAIRTPVGAGTRNHFTPIQDSRGIITPAGLHFFMMDSTDVLPDIDPREHQLTIHGFVDRPLTFSMDDLRRLPAVSRIHFVECAGNASPTFRGNKDTQTVQETHGKMACSEWTGVPLSLLLREAGLKKKGTWLVAQSADAGKHSRSIPIEKAMDDVLVAYGQNGEAVRREQGYPIRLLVPGWEGNINVKWLRRIEVTDEPYVNQKETSYVGMWPSLKGKSRWYQFQLGPKSVITRPSGGQRLERRGFYEITGLAWSGGGAVRKVEVSTDAGKSWHEALIHGPAFRMAHTRFSVPWTWNGEETVLMSRCIDDQGEVQPTLEWLGKVRGVTKDWWLTTKTWINHVNAIQPWKVNRDGSVENAMFT